MQFHRGLKLSNSSSKQQERHCVETKVCQRNIPEEFDSLIPHYLYMQTYHSMIKVERTTESHLIQPPVPHQEHYRETEAN